MQPGHCFLAIPIPGRQFIFMLILGVLVSLNTYAQSFFYLENKIAVQDKPSTTYQTFLMIEPDGDVIARIRFTKPGSEDYQVVELRFIDSLVAGLEADNTQKFLYSFGEPAVIMGSGYADLLIPRLIFSRKVDSLGAFYSPEALEVSLDNVNWIAAEMIRNEERSYKELKRIKDTLQLFYQEEDPVYKFFVETKARGNPVARLEKMFLVVVANSDDPTIGASSKKDFDKITKTYTSLAKDLGVKTVVPYYIWGDGFSIKEVQNALKKINPSPIDIVIFYYSGHGFRYKDDNSKYPRMSFRTKKDPSRIGNNLSVEDVYEQILKKGAKVNIVMSDCCNEDVGANPRIGTEPIKSRGGIFGSFSFENAQRLFFPLNPLSIIIGTADVSQLATGNPEIGGFFTHYFVSELNQSLYGFETEAPNWTSIIAEAKKKATWKALSAFCENTNSRCKQTAIYNVVPPL